MRTVLQRFPPLLTALGILWPSCAGAQVGLRLEGPQLSWRLNGKPLGASEQWLQVRDLAAGDAFVPVPASATDGTFTGAAASLAFSGEWKRPGHAVELACIVTATPPRDRAITVRVSLPLDAAGWTWWDDALQSRRIEPGQHYARVLSWDGTRDVSAYPCCAVSGAQSGISLAVPLEEPRAYRLAYDAPRRALEAEFDLGLSPDALRLPARASFRLLVYAHDPAWGFRDALRRYYDLFPAYVERRAPGSGIWLLSFQPGQMACPWDYGLRFDEGAQNRAGYDCAHDILPFVYTEPWGKYEHFGNRPTPDGKPRYGPRAPLLTPDELKQAVVGDLNASPAIRDRHFNAPRAEVARAIVTSAVERQDGQWIWHHWTDEWSPNDWLSDVILDPDPALPEPNRASVTWQYELDPAFEAAKRSGGELGGVYLDSIASFIGFSCDDFRREHWRYTDIPLVANPQAKAPAESHTFESFAFATQVAQRMRAQGKYVIGNTFRPYMQYFCPLLDMIGAGETRSCGLASDDYYAYLRAYGYRKPVSWMDYAFVSPDVAWDQKERGMRRCLFYAVHPGTGPFAEPAQYEPSRPLFRYYEPLIQWLDEAGWQPVTLARATVPGLLVERYGPAQSALAGITFIALRNPGSDTIAAAVEVQPQALGMSFRQAADAARRNELIAWRLVRDEPSPLTAAAGADTLSVSASLAPDGAEVIAIGRRAALARLWLSEAADWLDRLAREARWLSTRSTETLADGDFEAGMGAWGTEHPPNARNADISIDEESRLDGERSLKVECHADNAFQALHQNVVLPGGRDYVLRFKYRWERPEGAAGTVTPRFGVTGPDGNWVSDRYIHFRDLQPTGDRPATWERTFTVPADHSVGFSQFLFDGQFGTIWIDDVSVTSPEIDRGRRGIAQVSRDAESARDRLQAASARGRVRELLRLAAQQEPVFRSLRQLARDLPAEHTRRCLQLPAEDFAEAIGRSVEVLTGVAMHPSGSPPFTDAAAGDEAQLKPVLLIGSSRAEELTVSADGSPAGPVETAGNALTCTVGVKTAARVGWGWQDAMVEARFRIGAEEVWLPRRATIRLHPPLDFGDAGPTDTVGRALRLTVRSWLSTPAPVTVAGLARLGDAEVALQPTRVEVSPETQEVAVPLPPETAQQLDDAAVSDASVKLSWRAEGPREATAAGELEVPVVRGAECPRLGATPTLDGTIGAAEWQGAARLDDFRGAHDGKPATRPTTVLLGHNDATLWIAFACTGQPEPQGIDRPHDAAVWEDDAVEVFLQPAGSDAYYHFAVNAAGARYEARCLNGIDSTWGADWHAKTGLVGDGWTVEIAIPLNSLGAAPRGLWRADFGREEADTKAATCWAPTFDGFHTPARFGVIRF